jgi:hypothetical protein
MSAAAHPHQLAWIPDEPAPLCHIPWMGTAVVLADGSVNFCCYSSAVIGNVNAQPFDEIWNGPIITGIREALRSQILPPQCQSTSCPIYRGDELTNLMVDLEPHGFLATGTHDPHAGIRQRLHGTRVRAKAGGDSPGLVLEVCYRGEPLKADVFLAIHYPGSIIRFLPDLDEVPEPALCGVELRADLAPVRFDGIRIPAGGDRISAALFATGSDPNRYSNCYWSETIPFPIAEITAPDELRRQAIGLCEDGLK